MTENSTREPTISRVEIVPARPEPADLRRIRHLSAERNVDVPEVTYVVKVYLDDLPEPAGQAFDLFVGEHRVTKYTEFPEGVYFQVNDPYEIDSLRGESVRIRVPDEERFLDSEAAFAPPAPPKLGLAEGNLSPPELRSVKAVLKD